MMNRRVLISVVLTGLASVACGNASFFGGGSAKKTVQTNPSNQPTQNPGGNPTPPPPTQPTPTDPSSKPQIGPQNQVTQPDPKTIIFGKDQVFHIGDGRYDNTSCKEQVAALPLTGNAYFFEFEVTTDNTVVSVNTAKICGIDYATNTYELYSGMNRIQGQYIPRGQETLTAAQIPLPRGRYGVVLATGWGRDSGEARNDRDDYIVGHVTIQANQPIRPLNYGAFTRR
jgi:hypothetical protein